MRNYFTKIALDYIDAKKILQSYYAKKSIAQQVDWQAPDLQRDSPEILIEPQESLVQQACNELKKIDPNYFVGVKKIKVQSIPGAFGKAETGPGKDPTTIYIDLDAIKKSIDLGSSEEEAKELIKKEIIKTVGSVVGHEKGHIQPFIDAIKKKQQGTEITSPPQLASETEAEAAALEMEKRLNF